ncbi:MAG TPA: Co2+/Mg2+ efflux protein ApaG, partial [Massilia sp.]|nr:Co2+/Mg2+ efflux protein ApaG [Massilia sp.]
MSAYDFTVTVRTQHLPEQSNPERDNYVFSYTITIRNTGSVPAQLISRHWVITDANNRTQEVSGLGVVGHQPLLKPGEHFEYTSGTQ